MNAALLLLAIAAPPALPNLDFAQGLQPQWQGDGFDLVEGQGVSSADRDNKGRKAMLHRTFVVPPGAGTLHFTALASKDDERLNVYLEAAKRTLVPRRVRTTRGFEKSTRLVASDKNRGYEYYWDVSDRVGETLRIIVLDHCVEPGHHVICSGFRLDAADQFETREFVAHMENLVRRHKLAALENPCTSKHFVAVGNAERTFMQAQLDRCELLHQEFLHHFRFKGFALRPPTTRLMLAIFANQEGLEAYVEHRTSNTITGVYHPPSNRLVVYDFARNRAFVKGKERAEEMTKQVNPFERVHALGRVFREADELREEINFSTILHEASHQMAFNTGLLNRDGDLPLWLVEGLATYCEPTEKGFWKGMGAPNEQRLAGLRRGLKGDWRFLPLRTLVQNDRWLHAANVSDQQILMGYSQSWALVRMLLEEEPRTLQKYCAALYSRRTGDHRLTDFGESFGDLATLEKRLQEYIRKIAAR